MKSLNNTEMKSFLNSIESEYDVRVPIRLHDGTRSLGQPKDGEMALEGGKLSAKPTCVFFPQTEEVFVSKEGQYKMAQAPAKPLFVIGYTAEDVDCLSFVDKFFSERFQDDMYMSKRNKSVVAVVSGSCGKNGEFLKLAGKNCDLEFVRDGEEYIVAAYTDKGRALEAKIKTSKTSSNLDKFMSKSKNMVDENYEMIKRASQLMVANKVPDSFWNEIADRCIACTSCNYTCPTCTCFEAYDRTFKDEVVRTRMWDSRQLDGFMREASGHNPMGSEMSRTRRRIHHKLVADLQRWGHITCYNCGRCDDNCPTGIGIRMVSKEIVQRFS